MSSACYAAPDEPQSTPWPESYRQDANLFDVCFVDPQRGWAVGDRGTILHTQNGGETWQLQRCPVSGRLEGVHFIDPQHGWVVGGTTVPYSHRCVGFVLQTDDGGQSWRQPPHQFLPWLAGVHFTDAKNGVVYGIPSAMFPSAVFSTQDGGNHWNPWPGASTGWATGLISEQGRGLLVERTGQLVQVEPGSLRPLGKLKQETRLPLRLSDNGQGQWLLCGNQGLVKTSLDQGKTWHAPRGLPTAALLSEFDWQAVESSGENAWIAGVPGSRILATRDRGDHWELQETDNKLPLYAMDFLDDQRGWAVGAMGTVLVTHDGGEHWTHQRGKGRHLAVLGVFGEAAQVPWEMVAQLAAGEGYWTRLEVLANGVSLPIHTGQTPPATRLHEATVMLGGVGANMIQSLPAPDARLGWSAAQLSQRWDQISGAPAAQQLTEYLVRQIRTWEPDLVVVTQPSDPADGLNELARQIALQASEQAADANRYSAQVSAGLTPWRVSRVTSLSADPGGNGYPVNGGQLILSLGDTVGHLADRARANVHPSFQPGPDRMVLRTLDGDASARRGLFATPGGGQGATTRRVQEELSTDIRAGSQQAQRRRNLATLLRDATPGDEAVWQQILHLASELSSTHRGELWMTTADRCLRTGQAPLAFDLWNQLQREPGPQPLQEAARIRLFWYLASEEASLHWPQATASRIEHVAQAGTVKAIRSQAGRSSVTPIPTVLDSSGKVQPATAVAPAGDSNELSAQRIKDAEMLMATIQREQPDLYFEPMLRFPLAALQRRTDQREEAEKFWRSQMSGRIDPAYRSWAASELALLVPESLPARPSWPCPRLKRPPHLDGRLDDPVWSTITATSLQSVFAAASAPSATQVRLAYDAEFLYLAVRGEKVSGLTYSKPDSTRRRDQVSAEDRVEVYLDVDRDGVTHWCFQIDHRGWASERLNDDPSWNPQWYIASADDDSAWTLEAAIPLDALSRYPVTPGTCWCLGLQRILPGHDWETWLQPAPVEASPAEFGLLCFE